MRSKVVLPILGFGLAVLLFLVVARREGTRDANSAQAKAVEGGASTQAASDLANNHTKEPGKGIKTAAPDTLASDASKSGGSGTGAQPSPGTGGATNRLTHEEYVDQRVGELMDLAMNDDSASLNTILSELNNSDLDIRKAAIEAVKQFGSLDAIPKLEEAVGRSTEGTDKKALEEAIEFLKLPPLTARKN